MNALFSVLFLNAESQIIITFLVNIFFPFFSPGHVIDLSASFSMPTLIMTLDPMDWLF